MKKRILLCVFLLFLVPLSGLAREPSKISFDFYDADIKNVLKILADLSGKNILVAEDVKGKVTIRLDGVSWEEALDVILKGNDLSKIEDDRVIRVVTMKKFLDERKRDRDEKMEFLREREARQKLEEDLITETVFINYVDALEMEKIIRGDEKEKKFKGLLTANGAVIPVKWTNSLIIKESKENLEQIKVRIREHDIAPSQVQIEARIVEANSDFSRELGVQWNATYRKGDNSTSGGVGYVQPTVPASPAPIPAPTPIPLPFVPAGSLGVLIGAASDSFRLDARLSALESEGRGKIISNPKVVASDNQPAVIKQGTQIPYQSVSQNGTQTQFIDAVLSLEVTPHVTKDGNVSMKIKATKDKPIYILGSPVPGIDKKEATTHVLVRDGETVVVGGIYEAEQSEMNEGIPLLRKLPLLGWLFFNYDKKANIKKELLIFVTPSVLRNKYAEVGVK